ncbi:hypothetical protein [Micromonospora sp. LOL_021]
MITTDSALLAATATAATATAVAVGQIQSPAAWDLAGHSWSN